VRRAAVILMTLASCSIAAAGTLTVSGQARLEIPADQFSLHIGVADVAEKVADARAKVDSTMATLTEVVTKAGLERHTEWHTDRYDITPQWKPRPRNIDPSTWEPSIIGYRVSSGISITSTKMAIAGTLIADAARSGANDIGALRFSLEDPRSSRAKAIQTAARHAIEDAIELASASSVLLVKINRLSLDGANASPPRPVEHAYMVGTAMRSMDLDSAPDISGGMVTVTASVTAEWEIAPSIGAQPHQSETSD